MPTASFDRTAPRLTKRVRANPNFYTSEDEQMRVLFALFAMLTLAVLMMGHSPSHLASVMFDDRATTAKSVAGVINQSAPSHMIGSAAAPPHPNPNPIQACHIDRSACAHAKECS